MSPIEAVALVMLGFLIIALMVCTYCITELKYDRKNRQELESELEAERIVLKEQVQVLAKQSFEIGSKWTELSDKVGQLTTKLSAVQANQNNSSIGGRTR